MVGHNRPDRYIALRFKGLGRGDGIGLNLVKSLHPEENINGINVIPTFNAGGCFQFPYGNFDLATRPATEDMHTDAKKKSQTACVAIPDRN